MKKKTALFLIIMLVLSSIMMTGCHEKYDLAQLAKEEAEARAEAEQKAREEAIANGELVEEEEAEEEEEVAEEVNTPPPSSILGKTTATTYSNSYFAVKYTSPGENWYIANQKEIGNIMGLTSSSINSEEILKILEDSGFVMDFYAMDSKSADSSKIDNINITIEDIGKMYGVLLSEKDLADSSLSASKKALESQGWTNVNMEVAETVFCGVPRVCTVSSAESGKTKMFQKQVYLKKESFLACVTVASFGSDKTDEMLKAFSQL